MENGKRAFLDHLYTVHIDTLNKSACNRLNFDKDKANEVVQETFFIACLKVDALYESENPLKWLMSVQNFVIKREKFRLWTGKKEEGSYQFSKEIDIDTVSEEDLPIEEIEFYEETLFEELEGILSKREMEFIKERYFHDKTYKDIAGTLQITESACTSFGNRIHKKIKKILKKRDKTSKNLDI